MKKLLTILLSLSFAIMHVNSETITFSADSMNGIAGSKKDTTILTGNAFVKTGTMEIKADTIELSGEEFRYITATGSVNGINEESQMDFKCGKMKYDRTTKIAQLEDSVTLIDKVNEVSAEAQLIEYNQTSEIAIMQIEVSIKQKDNVCNSAYAIYRKEAQILEMSGNPKIVQGKDSFRAQEIILNLESQEITLDGRVKGTVTDSKDSEPAPVNDNKQTDNTEIETTPPASENQNEETSEEKPAEEITTNETMRGE